jgi:hypothetical protein
VLAGPLEELELEAEAEVETLCELDVVEVEETDELLLVDGTPVTSGAQTMLKDTAMGVAYIVGLAPELAADGA